MLGKEDVIIFLSRFLLLDVRESQTNDLISQLLQLFDLENARLLKLNEVLIDDQLDCSSNVTVFCVFVHLFNFFELLLCLHLLDFLLGLLLLNLYLRLKLVHHVLKFGGERQLCQLFKISHFCNLVVEDRSFYKFVLQYVFQK